MKNTIRLILLILILFPASRLSSQTLVSVRVYFDSPNQGYQYFAVPGLQSIDQPFEVDVSGQSAGLHRLYVEVMNDEGIWSLYDDAIVHLVGGLNMATLNAVEYFFDTDPGLGEAIMIAVSGNQISESFDLNLTGLNNGIHTLYIRVRDGAGQWSLYDKKTIHVVGSMMEEITAAEYFYDVDPGFGEANPVDLSDFTDEASLQLEIGDLQTGVHVLYFRVKDAKGIWSVYDRENILVTNPISPSDLVLAEYYFDGNDPGEGNAIPLAIPQQAVVDGDFEINIPGNFTGSHSVCIRVLNGAGLWSAVSCQSFNVCAVELPEIALVGNDCSNEPYELSVQSGIYDSILWSTDETTESILITEPGEYTVTVNNDGCSAVESIIADFELVDEPIVEVSGSVCAGNTQVLEVIGNYDGYLWPDGSDGASYEVTQSGDYEVEVTSGVCVFNVTTAVSFIGIEPVEIAVSGEACTGGTQTLTIDVGYTDIIWSDNSTDYALEVTAGGVYSVTANSSGCPVQASVEISFDEQPVFELQSSGGNCEGDLITLTVVPDSYTYDWFDNSSESNVIVSESGTYAVDVINGACVSSSSYTVDLISVPVPQISSNGNALACDLSGFTYQWYFNGSPINGATSQIYLATASGFYAVEITDDGCSNISALFNHTFIGIAENDLNEIQVYPIPVTDVMNVSSREVITAFELIDMSGRIIFNGNHTSNTIALDVRNLADGQYVLKLHTPSGVSIKKVLKG